MRRLIYTTNTVEGRHRQLRQVTKTKGASLNPEATCKLVYLVTQNINRTWNTPAFNWPALLNQLAIHFEGRLPVD